MLSNIEPQLSHGVITPILVLGYFVALGAHGNEIRRTVILGNTPRDNVMNVELGFAARCATTLANIVIAFADLVACLLPVWTAIPILATAPMRGAFTPHKGVSAFGRTKATPVDTVYRLLVGLIAMLTSGGNYGRGSLSQSHALRRAKAFVDMAGRSLKLNIAMLTGEGDAILTGGTMALVGAEASNGRTLCERFRGDFKVLAAILASAWDTLLCVELSATRRAVFAPGTSLCLKRLSADFTSNDDAILATFIRAVFSRGLALGNSERAVTTDARFNNRHISVLSAKNIQQVRVGA